jgi:hypothetical protein
MALKTEMLMKLKVDEIVSWWNENCNLNNYHVYEIESWLNHEAMKS